MARNITLAFAGSGQVKKQTVFALLNDFLSFGPLDADGYPEPSEHEIRIIIPASTEHTNDNLQTVVDWTEHADLPYEVVLAKGDRDDALERIVEEAAETHEVPNVDQKVIDLLKTAEDEKFLVLLWNDSDEHTEILLDLADTAGIKALDLTEGLDDLSFADPDSEPEKAPEPEPEPEKPVRGRRGSRKAAATEEEPQEAKEAEKPARGRRRGREEPLEQDDDEQPLTEGDDAPAAEPEAAPEPEEVKPARRGRARAAAPEEKAEEKVALAKDVAVSVTAADEADRVLSIQTIDTAYISGALQSIFLHLQSVDAANAYKNLADPIESPVTALTREALEHVTLGAPVAAEEPEEAKRGRGRPRTSPETVGYLKNADGVHRKAGRGRPKRGEEKVDLTTSEVADLQEKGLILDED